MNENPLIEAALTHPKKHLFTFLGILCAALALISGKFIVFSAMLLALLMVLILVSVSRNVSRKYIILLMIGCGFMLRLAYIIYTAAEQRQHDVHSFGGPDGHAAYIEYLYNNLRLPDFDPTTVWQFYHPPLHHIICAVWLKIQTFLTIDYAAAIENLQFLTLFYSLCCMIICYRLLRWFKLKGFALYMPMAIICFHPTFIIMSGSVNNDILSVTFALGALLCALRWYDSPTFGGIIKTALCIGLGMSTKLSAALVAPAVALIFLIKFIKGKDIRKKLMLQFCAFGAICLPLGLWWSIRNMVLYNVPFSYVPKMSEDNWQFNGNYPVFQRFFDFSSYQFKNLFISWGKDYGLGVESYFEFNPTIGLLKSAVFGEYYYPAESPLFVAIAQILFYSGILIALTTIVSVIFCLIKRDVPARVKIGFASLVLTAVIILYSYYSFCISFAQTCTMNMRYAVPLIPISAVFIGYSIKYLNENDIKLARIFKIYTAIIALLFCGSSAVFYTMIGA